MVIKFIFLGALFIVAAIANTTTVSQSECAMESIQDRPYFPKVAPRLPTAPEDNFVIHEPIDFAKRNDIQPKT